MGSDVNHSLTGKEADGPERERELISSLKAGDMKAYRILFARYYPKFLHFATIMVGGGIDDAKDIMQDVFVKIWRYRDRLDETLSLYNYIYVLTKREVLNHLRSRHVPDSLPEDDGILSEESVDRTVSGNEMAAIVNGIVREMPQPKRKIFLMSRFNGLPVKEIAKALNLSTRAVNYHIETALKFLRERLSILG